MEIFIHAKHIVLTDRENQYVDQKLRTLEKFDALLSGPAAKITCNVEHTDIKTTDHKVFIEATMNVSAATLHAEAHGMTVQEAADLLEDKLRRQIQKHKEKHISH